MPGKRILLEHEIERLIQAIVRKLPRHQRPFGEIGGHQRLPYAPDRPAAQHGPDPLHDHFGIESGLLCDLAERIADESLNAILGYGQICALMASV